MNRKGCSDERPFLHCARNKHFLKLAPLFTVERSVFSMGAAYSADRNAQIKAFGHVVDLGKYADIRSSGSLSEKSRCGPIRDLSIGSTKRHASANPSRANRHLAGERSLSNPACAGRWRMAVGHPEAAQASSGHAGQSGRHKRWVRSARRGSNRTRVMPKQDFQPRFRFLFALQSV